jgi:hypothetical protein
MTPFSYAKAFPDLGVHWGPEVIICAGDVSLLTPDTAILTARVTLLQSRESIYSEHVKRIKTVVSLMLPKKNTTM